MCTCYNLVAFSILTRNYIILCKKLRLFTVSSALNAPPYWYVCFVFIASYFQTRCQNVFLMHINWEMALVQFRGRSKFGDSLLIQIIAKNHTYCDILPIFSIFKCHLPRVWRAMFKELTALRNYVLIWNAQFTLKNKRWWFGPRTNKQSVHYWDSF